jgi:serine/threonine protein kinase/tetratricopeptide (TPR) repeat protein
MRTSDRDLWTEVKRLFGQAVELEPEARRALLDHETVGRPELRARVEALLGADAEATGFLEGGPADGGADAERWVGRRFGAYEVVGVVGRGGTGVVLLGARADGRYEGRVALKVVPAALVQGQAQARFRSEIRILADLDHPNIARLLDAGETPEGLTYLVLELVDGPRIDVFADERSLDVRARLVLFRSVLDGVAYAHARNVVHRDLKPSNILVTAAGAPKLVDFGIAKLLGAVDGISTLSTARLMTPEYASPEQARGAAVDVRSDVYSLGVVLYRLLTGEAPYRLDPSEPRSVERVICEETPTRPSEVVAEPRSAATPYASAPPPATAVAERRSSTPDRLGRELRGDLDAIVLHALAKEPEGRYPTARDFAADVTRYLEGRPIHARSPGPLHRTRRFLRRHRLASWGAAVGMVALSALGWQVREAGLQRRAAEATSLELTGLVNSVITTLDTDVAGEDSGPTARRVQAVQAAVASLEELAARVPGRPTPELLSALARAYEEVGALQGNPLSPNLGDVEAAEASLLRAIELWGEVSEGSADPVEAANARAGARVQLADVYRAQGRGAEIDELLRLARATVDSIAEEREPTLPLLKRRAMVYERLAWQADAQGDYERAAAHVARVTETARAMVALSPDGTARLNALQSEILTLQHQSYLWDKAARFSEAIDLQRRAVRIADSLASLAGATPRTRGIHAESLAQLGWRLNDADLAVEAEAAFTAALEITAEMQRDDPMNLAALLARGSYLDGRGQARLRGEKWADAVTDHLEAVSLLEPRMSSHPIASVVVIQAHRELGEAYTRLGRFEEASRAYVTSIAQAEAFFRSDTTNALSRKILALGHLSHALHYRLRVAATGQDAHCGPAAEAEAHGREAWAWLRANNQAYPGEETIWSAFEAMMPADACPAA